MKSLFFLFFTGFITLSTAMAQQTVTGVVVDNEGIPIPGVNVVERGTANGVITDFDGEFSIQVPGDAVLVFSYVGFQRQEIPVGNRNNINVNLVEDASQLDEVVVIGYGEESRANLTTSVTKLDTQVLENVPYANAASAMQGTLPGVRVQTTTGQPGATPRIIVRGGTSINNPNGATPLYVIDGVIRENMDNLDGNNIESMQVLKDAAATSIYGARGSNGVVVITTKTGEAGKNIISYSYSNMLSQVGNTYDMVPARDFIKFYRQAVVASARGIPSYINFLDQATPGGTGNDLTPETGYTTQYLTPENEHKLNEGWESMEDPIDPSRTIIFQDTDWQDVLFRTGMSHDHNLSFSGGTEKGTFNLGLGYLDNEGTAVGTWYNRLSLNFNGDLQVKENIKIYSRMMFSQSHHRGEGWNYARGQAIAPTAKYRLEDGSLARSIHSNYRNPEYYNASQDVKNRQNNLTIAIGSIWDILPGLSFEPQISYFSTAVNERFFQKAGYINSPTSFTDSRVATGYHSDLDQYQADAILSYTKSFNNLHNISMTGGYSYFKRDISFLSAQGQDAATDLIPTLNASAVPTNVDGEESSQLIYGYFYRLNYNYDQRYLLTLTGRYDGASNLGDDYKWGFFPGVSAGWNIHRENFWNSDSDFVSTLKLRASYGENGNIADLGDYEAQGVYSVERRYGGNSAITHSVLANQELQWETSKTLNFGIDVGLFNNRITLISDVYRKVTDNLLTNLPLPPTTGFNNIRTNLGSLENRGFELELAANILPDESNLQWDASFNIAYVENKILKLPDNGVENNRVGGYNLWDPSIGDYAWLGGLQEGEPLGNMYGYIQESIYRTDAEAAEAPVDMIMPLADKTKHGGDVNWRDLDENGIIDQRDRAYMGNIFPKWTGGFSNNISYKNFRLGIRMDYTLGHTIYDWSNALILGVYGTRNGFTTAVYDTWQEQGDVAKYARVHWGDQNVKRNYARNAANEDYGNSMFYQSGDFLALRELTLAYSLPKEHIERFGFSNLRINVTGNNLHYFTKYEGLSPEDGGRDFGIYPIPKQLVLGIKADF